VKTIAGALLCVVSLAMCGSARANFIFDFDEFGNGSFSTDGTHFTPSLGVLLPDPTQATHPLVLSYFLPQTPVGNGDVIVLEAPTIVSDDIRFTDAAGHLTGGTADRMIYYSDNGGGTDIDAPADTGFPPIGGTKLFEIGPEGNNGFTYNASGGFASGGNTYNGISDGIAVPLPASVWVGLFMLAALATSRWIHRRSGQLEF